MSWYFCQTCLYYFDILTSWLDCSCFITRETPSSNKLLVDELPPPYKT